MDEEIRNHLPKNWVVLVANGDDSSSISNVLRHQLVKVEKKLRRSSRKKNLPPVSTISPMVIAFSFQSGRVLNLLRKLLVLLSHLPDLTLLLANNHVLQYQPHQREAKTLSDDFLYTFNSLDIQHEQSMLPSTATKPSHETFVQLVHMDKDLLTHSNHVQSSSSSSPSKTNRDGPLLTTTTVDGKSPSLSKTNHREQALPSPTLPNRRPSPPPKNEHKQVLTSTTVDNPSSYTCPTASSDCENQIRKQKVLLKLPTTKKTPKPNDDLMNSEPKMDFTQLSPDLFTPRALTTAPIDIEMPSDSEKPAWLLCIEKLTDDGIKDYDNKVDEVIREMNDKIEQIRRQQDEFKKEMNEMIDGIMERWIEQKKSLIKNHKPKKLKRLNK